MGNLKENFYLHDDGDVEIYIGNSRETIVIPKELIGKMNQAIAEKLYEPMSKEYSKELNNEAKVNKYIQKDPSWGYEMHPDYPKC